MGKKVKKPRTCPHCNVKLMVDPKQPGFGHCPKCHSSFMLAAAHY
jgi:ribosomal protein L37AE/L43A